MRLLEDRERSAGRDERSVYVLTAGHCVRGNKYPRPSTFAIGTLRLPARSDELHALRRVHVPNEYLRATAQRGTENVGVPWDLAIVESPITTRDTSLPASMSSVQAFSDPLALGYEFYGAWGYGVVDLQQTPSSALKVAITKRVSCPSTFAQAQFMCVTEAQEYAGRGAGLPYNVDSGGPLFYRKGYLYVGVYQGVARDDAGSNMNVYTLPNHAAYKTWISSVFPL